MSLRSSFVGVRKVMWRPMRPGRVSAGSRFCDRDVRRADEVDLRSARLRAREPERHRPCLRRVPERLDPRVDDRGSRRATIIDPPDDPATGEAIALKPETAAMPLTSSDCSCDDDQQGEDPPPGLPDPARHEVDRVEERFVLFVSTRLKNGGLSMPSMTTSSWLSASPPPMPPMPGNMPWLTMLPILWTNGGYGDRLSGARWANT